MQLWALIVDSFRESRDRKIFWLLFGLTLLIALTMASFGFKADRVTFLFGLFDAKTTAYNPYAPEGAKAIASIIVYYIMSIFLGWIAVTLMVVATAGMLPSMMQGGTIDVVLSKPISRPRLFLYKYLAGMVFVLFQAALFVGLTFLVAGLCWKVWLPGYLLSIPLLVLLFSYIYGVSVFMGVLTRSGTAAILVSLGAWVVFAQVHGLPGLLEYMGLLKDRPKTLAALKVVSWIPPKTADIPYLAAKWSGAGISLDAMAGSVPTSSADQDGSAGLDAEEFARVRRMEEEQLNKSAAASIGSSLGFETVIVLLAMWRFNRRDF